MIRPKVTTPEAKSGPRGVGRESLLGGLRANRGVKATIGAAVLSTTLWLAGCGNSDAGAGSDGQSRPQKDTASSAPENPGTQGSPVIDQGKLQTAEGRMELFQEQGKAMMLIVAEAMGNNEGTVKGALGAPDAFGFHTDSASIFKENSDYYTEAVIVSIYQQMEMEGYLPSGAQYEDGDVSSDTQYEDDDESSSLQNQGEDVPLDQVEIPPGYTDVSFSMGGLTPVSEGTSVDVTVALFVSENILEQSPTPQSLRENLESNEDSVRVWTIGVVEYDSSKQKKVDRTIYLEDDELVMEELTITDGYGARGDGYEFVDQAEPFGEVISSADRILTDLLAQY